MVKNRMTPQRKLIMELMNENYSHPTADEVYAAARTEDSKISRGTVYRNLNFLADSGDITRLRIPIGPDHYDFRQRDHYHFFCRKCQKVFDTKLPYMTELSKLEDGLPGFVTERHSLLLIGLCPDCSADNKTQSDGGN